MNRLYRRIRGDYVKRQRGRCAVCNDITEEPLLDHSHRTGAVRGAICRKCNTGLGNFCDSPELLRRAAEYVEIPRISRFPRCLTQSEGGKLNVAKANAASRILPRTQKQLDAIRENQKLRWRGGN